MSDVRIHVLFDITVLGLSMLYESARTGVFRVTEQLAAGLAHREDLDLSFCSIHGTTHDAPEIAEACRRYLAGSPQLSGFPFHETISLQVDVYHSPFHPLSRRITARTRFLLVHDLIAVMHPEFFTPGQVEESRLLLQSFQPGDHFFTVSESTKRDLCEETGISSSYVTTTPLAASHELFHPCRSTQMGREVRRKYGLGERPYLLSVCTLEPRKNLEQVVRCFTKLVRSDARPELLLVLTGTMGWLPKQLLETIGHDERVRERIVMTGYVPDSDLAPLYSEAEAFLYLSLYEGFGLPPLEAMQCGTPVITSNRSSLPEVVGDAGILIEPGDDRAVLQAILELTGNKAVHRMYSFTAQKQAALFSWEEMVTRTVRGYRAALDRSGTDCSPTPAQQPVTVVDGVFYQLSNTGIARVWTALLSEWAGTKFGDRIVVLDRAGTAPRVPGLRYRIVPAYDYHAVGWDRSMLQAVCDDEQADVFISTYYTTPLTTPSVFLAHDMIPEFTSFFNLAEPQWQEKHHAIDRASSFIAVSRNTAMDLVKLYPHLDGRVTVAHNGIDTSAFSPAPEEEVEALRRRLGMQQPYFLFIGSRDGYKNGRLLLEAYHRLPDRDNYALLYVGGRPVLDPNGRIITRAENIHLAKLTDRELVAAYTGAAAFVYPSIYEGFGLPILEAMACRCPVITCQNSSLPEVAGAAALYVPHDDPAELATAMLQVVAPEVRSQLVRMGTRQVAKFSWKKMADIVSRVVCEQHHATQSGAAREKGCRRRGPCIR